MNWKTTNKGFIYPSLLFFIAITMVLVTTEQGFGLRLFSENRSYFLDTFFIYGTKIGEEPSYALLTCLAFFICWRFALKIPLIGFSVMGISYLLKYLFQHKRPYQFYGELQQMDQFNIIDGIHLHMGYSSFPSGHTMSGFALFYIIAMHFHSKKRVGFLCFTFASIVGISRVYLFQHFLKDVLLGAILGIFIAHMIDNLFPHQKS